MKKFKNIIILIFIIILGSNILLYGYCYITPKLSIKKKQSYYLYDNSNNLIFNNNDNWIALSNISPYLVNATLSTEDKNFYKHLGFDYLRILSAALNNIKNKSLVQGASTISQQYARNLFLNYDKNWSRKFDEALLAAEIETHYTKDEILEGYLNTINYGGVFGIENASWYYFGHGANSLTLSEASMLAGIPQSPSNYSPIINEKLAKKRQLSVLKLMYKNKIITHKEMNYAYKTKLKYIGKSNLSKLNNVLYFRDAVMDELKSIDSIPKSILDTGGLKIYTTLDFNAQKCLEDAVSNNMNNSITDIQVAGMMMNPNNGGVMAMIGGYDYSSSQYNRALYAKRQVGSTIKPLLYYSALENGFTSSSSFISEKTTFNFSNNQSYTPNNYNNNYANFPITMGAAISFSDNIYAVKTHLFLGEYDLINTAKRLGVKSNLNPVPSLALGTSEISMFEMVQAYSSFANLGTSVEGHFIDRVEDSDGKVLYKFKNKNNLILNPSLVFILNEMLTYTYDSQFIDYNYPTVISLLPRITNKYSIKTGTTNTDMWIMGYNKNAVLSIWNGYDNNSIITSNDNVYHKNIWIDTMESYLKDKDNSWYNIPGDVVGVLVNPITGELANENDTHKKVFYYLKGTEPGYNSYNYEQVFRENNEIITEQ